MKKVVFAISFLVSSLNCSAEIIDISDKISIFAPAESGAYPFGAVMDYPLYTSSDFSFIGWKYELRSWYTWWDAGHGYTWEGNKGDFLLSFYVAGKLVGSDIIIDNGQDRIDGGIYNTEPLDLGSGTKYISFEITPYYENNNPYTIKPRFSFTYDNELWISNDTPLTLVPEPGTFALILLSFFGLCIRRQIKSNTEISI